MMSNDLLFYLNFLRNCSGCYSYKNELYYMEKPSELMRCSAVLWTFISLVKVTSYVRTRKREK